MRASGVETVIVVRESPPWGVGGQRAHTRTKQYIKMYICIIWREPGRRAPGNFLSQGKLSGEEEERKRKGGERGKRIGEQGEGGRKREKEGKGDNEGGGKGEEEWEPG